MKVRSKITAKYQITVPREIREILKLEPTDVLEWEVGAEGIKVHAADKPFLKLKGILRKGGGDTKAEIRAAWGKRAERYRK